MVIIDGVNIDAATSAGLLVDDSVVEATGIRIVRRSLTVEAQPAVAWSAQVARLRLRMPI